jgi:hypothetical protein
VKNIPENLFSGINFLGRIFYIREDLFYEIKYLAILFGSFPAWFSD